MVRGFPKRYGRRTAEIHGGEPTLDCPAHGGSVLKLTLPVQTRASERPAAART